MNIQPYIIDDIKPYPLNGKVGELKELFNELTFTHLPVEQNGVYMGSVYENDVRCFDAKKTMEDYQYALEGFFVRENDLWLDVLEAFAKNQTNLMPVLNEQNNYIGYLELHDIIKLFNSTPFLSEPGNILIVEKGMKDYSFSEISQIVESNSAKMLGAFVSKTENDLAQITIKTGNAGMNTIIQSFRRYGYNIISNHQEDSFYGNLKERSKYLDKYLNI